MRAGYLACQFAHHWPPASLSSAVRPVSMCKHVIAFIVFVLVCPLLWAGDTNFLSSVSPNLRKFLLDHPTAMKVLTNALSEAFSNRTVRLYYYYSDDPGERRANHFYPN